MCSGGAKTVHWREPDDGEHKELSCAPHMGWVGTEG